jgi:uncharacterized protein YkwD
MPPVRALCLFLVLTGCGLGPNGNHSVARRKAPPSASQEIHPSEQALLDRVNRERVANGRKPLIWDHKAGDVARVHSRDMANRWYFSHLDPQGRYVGERLRNAGIYWRWAGENIYMHKDGEETADSAVRGWMQSAGHRENILNANFTHTGVGIATGQDGTIYCTQVYFSR